MLDVTKFVREFVMILAATTILVACTGAQTGGEPPPPPPPPAAPATEDLVFKDYETISLTGTLFVPEAIQKPAMVTIKIKGKANLKKQRRSYERAKPDKKAMEAMTLVTVLWEQSSGEGVAEADATSLQQEARDILKETFSELGADAGETLVQMLFRAEMALGNEAGALEVGTALIENYPDGKSTKAIAPYMAATYLRRWQTDDAAKLTANWTADGDPYEAYDVAWVQFRMGHYAAAKEAIVSAAKRWPSRATWPAVERDLILMVARAGTPVEEASATLAELSQGEVQLHYGWLYKLYEAYDLAGYARLGAAALDKAIAVIGDQITPADRFGIRFRQVSSYLTTHEPDKLADALIASYEAVGPCGEACAGRDEIVAQQIVKLAPFLHTTYTTTQDLNYYEPAKRLYEFYISLNRSDNETVKGYLNRLEETKERAVAASGKHDQDIILVSTNVRNQAVKACYEGVLQRQTSLTGEMTLSIEIADDGTVKNATSEPAPGDSGIAAVAGCAVERAKSWAFPSRSKKGITAAVRSYQFQPAES